MNDIQTQTHFAAVCPHCSTSLKIRRAFAGQPVKCKHCEKTFVAQDTGDPGAAGSHANGAGDSSPTNSQAERITIACPSCHATLSVRRAYIGRPVRCKHCDEPFLIQDPTTGAGPTPISHPDRSEVDERIAALQADLEQRNQELKVALDQLEIDLDRAKAIQAKLDQLSAENQALRAENDRLQDALEQAASVQAEKDRLSIENRDLDAANGRLQAESDRLASECQRLRDAHESLLAGHEQAATEGQQLRAQFEELRNEHGRLREELDHATGERESIRAGLGEIAPEDVGPLLQERAALAAEVDRLEGEMQLLRLEKSAFDQERIAMGREGDVARTELDRLNELIKKQEEELESARVEKERLGTDRLRALAEAEQLQAALAEREHGEQAESDRSREETDRLRGEGDRLRGELEGLRRELADAEQGRLEGTARLVELGEKHRQVREQYESAERSCQDQEQRNQELLADLDRLRGSQPASGSAPASAPASNDDLQAARAEVESLRRKLDESERVRREMDGILVGIGIRYREV